MQFIKFSNELKLTSQWSADNPVFLTLFHFIWVVYKQLERQWEVTKSFDACNRPWLPTGNISFVICKVPSVSGKITYDELLVIIKCTRLKPRHDVTAPHGVRRRGNFFLAELFDQIWLANENISSLCLHRITIRN